MVRPGRSGSTFAPGPRALGMVGGLACLALALPMVAHAEDAQGGDAARNLRLAHLVADGTWYQRSEAAEALQNAGIHAAVAAPLLRDTAVAAIGRQDWRLAHLAIDTLGAVAPDKLSDCAGPLDPILGGSDADARKEALHLTNQLGHAAASLAPRLAALAKDQTVATEAMQALVAVGATADALPIFQGALRSSDPDLVLAAVTGLAGLGAKSDALTPALCGLLTKPRYAGAALQALAGMGKAASAAVPAVVLAAAANNAVDRAAFVRTLRAIEAEDIAPSCAAVSATCVEGRTVRVHLPVVDPDDHWSDLKAAAAPAKLHGHVGWDSVNAVYTAAYGWTGSEDIACTVTDHAGKTVATTITLTVTPDLQPPSLVQACLVASDGGVVRLAFDKPLQKPSAERATCYSIVPGVAVVMAALRENPREVDLTTTGIQVGHAYTIAVRGVLSGAAAPVPSDVSGHPFQASVGLPGLAVTWFSNERFAGATSTGAAVCLNYPDGPRPRAEHYAARYEGWLAADADATYTLTLSSDDGSRLWLDDQLLIDNWGTHPRTSASAQVALTRAKRAKLRVDYFQGATQECLLLEWSHDGAKPVVIPPSAFSHDP